MRVAIDDRETGVSDLSIEFMERELVREAP